MALKDEEGQEPINALEMSDEDIMNMTEPPGFTENEDVVLSDDNDSEYSAAPEGSEDSEDFSGQDSGSEASGDDSDPDNLTGADDGLQEEEGQQASTEEEITTARAGDEGIPASVDEEDGQEASTDTKDTVTAEDQLAQLFAPFKANGRQMQVSNVQDVMSLMQMGANYNKKMAGMKPSLRMLKMLENNDLLDEDKISNLIDISKKNPAAIAHLVKDSGIDPLDIDTAEADDYKPETYTVDDREVELDSVLDDIRATPQFKDTMEIISTKLDLKSREELYEDPAAIKIINDHVGAGLFPQLMNIVENERAVGRLTDLSDIDAYKHVGDVIQANGGFARLENTEQPGMTQPAAVKQTPSAKKVGTSPQLKKQKRAAASTKGSPGGAAAEYNPLALSDEEFNKIAGGSLM